MSRTRPVSPSSSPCPGLTREFSETSWPVGKLTPPAPSRQPWLRRSPPGAGRGPEWTPGLYTPHPPIHPPSLPSLSLCPSLFMVVPLCVFIVVVDLCHIISFCQWRPTAHQRRELSGVTLHGSAPMQETTETKMMRVRLN